MFGEIPAAGIASDGGAARHLQIEPVGRLNTLDSIVGENALLPSRTVDNGMSRPAFNDFDHIPDDLGTIRGAIDRRA